MESPYNPPTAGHYAASALVPPYAIIAGIVAMSRSMVGPGLALWSVGFLGFWVVWPVIITILSVLSNS